MIRIIWQLQTSVQNLLPIQQVDVENFHEITENFDLLLAPDEK